ncbi:Uncharacterised protein [Shigella sonnei]|nr:Uncharacterised protein [Shigella sonnei]CSG31972.1 Uncharacterised protein [Shigella sonnei]CSP42098.1 Uncharacterised protein [Shigella sonnei]
MEIAIVIAHIEETAQTTNACVIHQDINAPFFFLRAFDSCGYRRRVTHIGDNRRTAMTTTTQFVRQLFDLRGDIQQD